jgi:hypothetical protein
MLRILIIVLLFGLSSVGQSLPDAPSTEPGRFLDKKNILLIGSLTVWQGVDAYKTELALDNGGQEKFPIARHFCQSRPGRIAYFSVSYASSIASSYLLHRAGHRRLARLVLAMGSASAASGVLFTIAHAQ